DDDPRHERTLTLAPSGAVYGRRPSVRLTWRHTGGLVASCCSFCCTCGRLSGLEAFCAFLALPLSLPFDRSPMPDAPWILDASPICRHYTLSAPPIACQMLPAHWTQCPRHR